jgi:hypothetical protein
LSPAELQPMRAQLARAPGLFARWRMGRIRAAPAGPSSRGNFYALLLAGAVTSFELVASRSDAGVAAASVRCVYTLRGQSEVVFHEVPLRAPALRFSSCGSKLQLLDGVAGWAAMQTAYRLTFLPYLLLAERAEPCAER